MRREYAGGAQPSTMAGAINATSTVLIGDEFLEWPDGSIGPFSVVLDRDTADEEKVLISTRNGTTLNVAQRGYDGTTGRNHTAGASIEHVGTAIDHDEANAHTNTALGVHGLDASDAVVGQEKTQTLRNKTIDGTQNTLLNIPESAIPVFVQIQADIDALQATVVALQAELDATQADLAAEIAARTAGDTDRYTKVEADARFFSSWPTTYAQLRDGPPA